MPNYVDPRRFIKKPVVLRSQLPGEAAVMIDGLKAGRILQQVRADMRLIYVWTLTGPYAIAAGLHSSGQARSLEEAKAAIRSAFDIWLNWALGQEKPVVWYG